MVDYPSKVYVSIDGDGFLVSVDDDLAKAREAAADYNKDYRPKIRVVPYRMVMGPARKARPATRARGKRHNPGHCMGAKCTERTGCPCQCWRCLEMRWFFDASGKLKKPAARGRGAS